MLYFNKLNGGFGVTLNELRKLFPDCSIPDNVLELGDWIGYFPSPMPEFSTLTHICHEVSPEAVDGVLTQAWSISPLDPLTASVNLASMRTDVAASVRTKRDRLLSQTDWRFRTDMTPSREWVDYCQALRDVPSQSGFPHMVVWPKQPLD